MSNDEKQLAKELEELIPTVALYYGATSNMEESIESDGIKPERSEFVHLSSDIEAAENVGGKYDGNPVIYKININGMIRDGHKFFKQTDDEYLTDSVLPEHLIKMEYYNGEWVEHTHAAKMTAEFKEFLEDLRMEQQEQM